MTEKDGVVIGGLLASLETEPQRPQRLQRPQRPQRLQRLQRHDSRKRDLFAKPATAELKKKEQQQQHKGRNERKLQFLWEKLKLHRKL